MTKVVILDAAQQGNSGDDIMQRALIELCQEHLSTDIKVLSYFGANEFTCAETEFSFYKENFGIEVSPGVASTHVFSNKSKQVLLIARFLSVFNILAFCILSSVKLGWLHRLAFMTKKQREVLADIEAADIIVWNGRNFRGSSSGGIREALKVAELCLNPLICGALKKDMVNFGSSVWELKSGVSRYFLSKVVSKCRKFYVREKTTQAYLEKILPAQLMKAVVYTPDLSFYVLQRLRANYPAPKRDNNLIALTIVGRRELESEEVYQHYLASLSKLVSSLTARGIRLVVVPQVTYSREPYQRELDYLRSQNPSADIQEYSLDGSVESLLECYSKVSCLIASRMHSAIYALSIDTPVYAIAYDAGAKWSILETLNHPRSLLSSAATVDAENVVSFTEDLGADVIDNAVALTEGASQIRAAFSSHFK